MMMLVMMLSSGVVKGVVLKNGIGIVFWIVGVFGMVDMVKVEVLSVSVVGSSLCGMFFVLNSVCFIGVRMKNVINRLILL